MIPSLHWGSCQEGDVDVARGRVSDGGGGRPETGETGQIIRIVTALIGHRNSRFVNVRWKE